LPFVIPWSSQASKHNMKFDFDTGVLEIRLYVLTSYELQRKNYVFIYKKSSYLF
jgi:hypothetical protein